MRGAKIHIAGRTINGVQRCERCRAQLNKGDVISSWHTGHRVWSDGRKNMRDVTATSDWNDSAKYESARPCGRQQ